MTKKVIANFDYAAKMTELESILERLQQSQTTLDTAIELHKQGEQCVAELETYLAEAEVVIRKQTHAA